MSDSPHNFIAGRKLRSLDGIRALAILLVFFHHMKDHIPALEPVTCGIQFYIWQGWIGVDLFFVLSGFLITGILIDTRESSNYFSGFYARRILRIFPLYYVVLTGFIVASPILTYLQIPKASDIAHMVPLPGERWVYFCYLTNWLGLWKQKWGGGSVLAHFWTLGVEEQFYFFWPLIIWLVRPRAIPWIAGTVALLSAVVRFLWAAHVGLYTLIPPVSIEITLATICRLDALFVGALCAYMYRVPSVMSRVEKWLPWIASAGVGSFFAACSVLWFFPQQVRTMLYGSAPIQNQSPEDAIRAFLLFGGFTLLAVGFGAFVLLAAHTEEKSTVMQKVLQSRVLAPIGRYSYGIYVLHVPIIALAGLYIFPRISAQTVTDRVIGEFSYLIVVAAVSYVISAASYEIFEKKILAYKRYFEPKYVAADASAEVPAIAMASAVRSAVEE